MSPFLPSPPRVRRLLVVGLLLAMAALLAATADRLTGALGAQGAGAYLDASGRLTVNVLGTRAAGQVRAAGATPRQVTRSMARLERVKAALDAAARNAPVGAS